MRVGVGLAGMTLLAVVGCTRESRSPDAVRDRTANVTASVARNTKAMAQGVAEGLRRKGPVNINKASRGELQELPGISSRDADAIVAHRPYLRGAELWRRKLVSRKEYNLIADKIAAR